MKFSLDTTDPVIKALLEYSEGDKDLLELAMHNALKKIPNGELVTIKLIKDQIDALTLQVAA